MSMSDPLADMLTRIRNGVKARFDSVEMPSSKAKVNIAKVLQDEGYVTGYQVDDSGVQGTLTINLKYGSDQTPVITGIKRVSKPGLRKYARAGEIPTVLNGLGIAILSSSKGVITDKTARASNVGGEILCEVW
ncbi:ribosomal protein S8 [Desulfocapsa sulfexigens DSM 10523]|uniref:Small ribosomal subunit protein uS8 n=1 Tax=Desulfocapsa sulfexigens (strain DSM 10523 / SB164P1) TaxID=1167006 RepID=M1NG19_DESSD|nr:30S ribosomal protein S8 [Desulfocapsa sulfexigens]AGF78604.1 ribosomal protein S8 [Desulfocapsa sulfexigens DSM 10523]